MHAGGRSLARRPAASAESQKTTRQLLRGRRPSALDRQPTSSSCRDPADLVPRSRPRSRSLSALVNARRFWLPGCWLDLRSGEAQSWQIFAPAKEHGRSMEGLEFHRADCRFRCNLAACPAELGRFSPTDCISEGCCPRHCKDRRQRCVLWEVLSGVHALQQAAVEGV